MIEINLVPAHLRKKKKRQILPEGFNIPIEVVIGAGGGLLLLLIFIHIFLLLTNMVKLAQQKGLQKQWEEILPAKTNVDAVISQMRDLQNKIKSIEEVTSVDKVLWSQKLNIISDNLPRGVWLRRISLSNEILSIEGSAISNQGKEMINVHSFASNLKNDKNFLNNLNEIEVGSIQRRNISGVEVADFMITTRIK